MGKNQTCGGRGDRKGKRGENYYRESARTHRRLPLTAVLQGVKGGKGKERELWRRGRSGGD